MKHPSIFILDKMPWEKKWTVRLHFPDIDNENALQFETEEDSREEAERICRVLVAAFPQVQLEGEKALADLPRKVRMQKDYDQLYRHQTSSQQSRQRPR